MLKRTRLSASLMLAFGGAATSMGVVAQQQALDRVEVTGSSIKRVEGEGALPVQVIKREDIVRSGATSVVDLLQKLPTAQSATTESTAVGGGGKGFSGVSVHNIGEERTLVLLNGRRLAVFAGQDITGSNAGFDLNTLPISAIERVEILTDGASALYGSDAIAGVVNFITKRNSQAGDISIGASRPSRPGASEGRVSLTKGFGDLDADGFNLMFTLAADKRRALQASQRDFSKTGVIDFSFEGQRYRTDQSSGRSAPANIYDDAGNPFSVYYLQTGKCGPNSFPSTDSASGTTSCRFDFTSALESFPQRNRRSLLTSFDKKLGEDHRLFADLLLSRSDSTGIIAPLPTEVSINQGTSLFNTYAAPYGITADTIASWRGTDLGRREDDNRSEFRNFVLGLSGRLSDWDYKTALSYSESRYNNNIKGYPGGLGLQRLLDSGVVDPFLLPGQQSPAALAAIQKTVYNGFWEGGKNRLTGLDFTATKELAQLSGGPLSLGTGVNVFKEKYDNYQSLFAQGKLADVVAGTPCVPTAVYPDPLACDQRAGDSAQAVPYKVKRTSWGAFGELVAPVVKELELTGSVRYDHYDDFGSTTNGKASFRWTPAKTFLVRGSVGSGFKAPSVPQVKATPQSFGVTGSTWDQTPDLQQVADRLGATLRPNGFQYDKTAGGNPNLKPEKSTQASIGFVFEPTSSTAVGADLWFVRLRDKIDNLAEQAVFGSPLAYPDAWTTFTDPVTGTKYLAWKVENLNLGKQYSTGIDFSLQGRGNTDFGLLTSQLVATYMLREDQQQVRDGPYYSAIDGKDNDVLGEVTFRWQGRWTNSLKTGNWLNSLTLNFKSGYRDPTTNVNVVGPDGTLTGDTADIRLKVKHYVTFDWQTQWQATKQLSFTAGILNLLNEDPPLTLAQGGIRQGQNYGYDDRYYDPRGRTYYLDAKFSF